jgi:H+/Cl- antiporter ClcA
MVGVGCGIASAVFLHLLARATAFRNAHEVIIYTLPIAGIVIGLIYERWGKSITRGNNLIIDSVHEESPQIPIRMAPMVLVGTVLTHLFGGSAGREGTAVQMGGSIADAIAHRMKIGQAGRRQLLAAGMAGGFGSVFGTPIAGALFGIEVVAMGRIEYDALVPALIAAIIGDRVTRALGVVHTVYPSPPFVAPTFLVLGKVVLIGVAMALVAIAFVDLTHFLKRHLEAKIPRLPIRMMAGGIAVVLMWRLIGTSDYLGLGIPTIIRAFHDPNLPSYAFAAKVVFTAVTLSAGFLGGEVTPLFFVGATLGNLLARHLGLPLELGAGIGIAAVFGAAANTPIALSVMAVELMGATIFPHAFIATVIAYLLSGHRGIYPSQRVFRRKWGGIPLANAIALRDLRDSLPGIPVEPSAAEKIAEGEKH